MTAWNQPFPVSILEWNHRAALCSHQSCALLNSRGCHSQRQRCQEGLRELGNRWPWEPTLPEPHPAGQAGSRASQHELLISRRALLLKARTLLTPRAHTHIRADAVSGQQNPSYLSLPGAPRPRTMLASGPPPFMSLLPRLGATSPAPPCNFYLWRGRSLLRPDSG